MKSARGDAPAVDAPDSFTGLPTMRPDDTHEPTTMDLRMQLVRRVAALSVGLLLLCCAGVLASLHEDVADEVAASSRLAELVQLAAGGSGPRGAEVARDVWRLLEGGQLRHVSVRLERAGQPAGEAAAAPVGASWADRLVDRFSTFVPALPAEQLIHRVPIGDDVLVIRPDPRSEVAEILQDAGRTLATLLLFALATVAASWFAAHRALAPVRELELGLARIGEAAQRAGAGGEDGLPPALPRFRLREFERISRAADQLARQLAAARAAQHRLAQRLIEVQEAERRDLARELHDEIGQSLTAIGVGAAYIDRHAERVSPDTLRDCARDIAQQSQAITAQVRGMLGRLRPHGLEGVGTLDALRQLGNGWRQRHGHVAQAAPGDPAGDGIGAARPAAGIALDMELPDELPPLAPAQSLALYRGLQEALTNVWRHSGARHCAVQLRHAAGPRGADGRLVLQVRDDGGGRAADVAARRGAGLLGMAERAAAAGGTMRLRDGPRGLCVELDLPVTEGGEAGVDTGRPER